MANREFFESFKKGVIFKYRIGRRVFYEWERYVDVGEQLRQVKSAFSQSLEKLKKLATTEELLSRMVHKKHGNNQDLLERKEVSHD